MCRLVTKGIGKRWIPNEIEGMETPAIQRPDYYFTTSIIYDHVIGYEEFVPNPNVPYYQYDGPLTEIVLSNGTERMIMMPFSVFDKYYSQHYAERTIMIRPN